ncbi:arsenate reductase ArsC [Nakamurella sp. DB0629]|uniref:Arsenate reductase ArsC n=1 Tax=Nakamurella aerolata TaxID=1656892 RepID=A0A849A612_9ACTN|nr:arsenate reductase ArsC [Nakamurella aerolata]
MVSKPSVLFVCVHNAGRSQMAAGYLTHLTGDQIEVRSAGSQPADQINPIAVAVMAEDGIDITTEHPKILTTDAVQASDVVITMGCGDTCPVFPGKRYEDWDLPDPAGQNIDAVRPIRDQIKARVRDLIASLGISSIERAASAARSAPSSRSSRAKASPEPGNHRSLTTSGSPRSPRASWWSPPRWSTH